MAKERDTDRRIELRSESLRQDLTVVRGEPWSRRGSV